MNINQFKVIAATVGCLAIGSANAQNVLSDYCDYPTGHMQDPNFGDASSHISFSIGQDDQGKMDVTITSRGHENKIDLLWVNTNYGSLIIGENKDECDECGTSMSAKFDLGDRKDDFVVNEIHWSYVGWRGEWASDGGYTVPYNASCNVVSDDNIAPTFTSATVVDGSITYKSVNISCDATDETSPAVCTKFYITDTENGIENQSFTVDGVTKVGTLNGLKPNTEYNLSIVARDDAGNRSEPKTVSFKTINRASECSITYGHFTAADKDINIDISYDNNVVTYTMTPINAGEELNYAEICIVNYGSHQMTISEDKHSAVYTHNDIVEAGTIFQSFFLYNFKSFEGNRQTSEGWGDFDRMNYYIMGGCNTSAVGDFTIDNCNIVATPTMVKNNMHIKSTEAINQYKIFDLNGRMIKNGNAFGLTDIDIDLSNIGAGNYIISINTDCKTENIRFAKR